MLLLQRLCFQQEEHDYGPVETPRGVRAYLTAYKLFSEPFTNVLKMAAADEVDVETCRNIEKMAANFMEQIRLCVNLTLWLVIPTCYVALQS